MPNDKRLRLKRDDDTNHDVLPFPASNVRHSDAPFSQAPSKAFIESVEETIEDAQRNLDALLKELEAVQEEEAYRFPDPQNSDDWPPSAA